MMFQTYEFIRGSMGRAHRNIEIFILKSGVDLGVRDAFKKLKSPRLILAVILAFTVIVSVAMVSRTEPDSGLQIKETYQASIGRIKNSSFFSAITQPMKIDQKIHEYSAKYEVDPALVKALVKVESNFDPYAVSHKGAMGLMQIDKITQKELGLSNPFEIDENLDAGIKYLRRLLDRYNNNTELALAAYNAGPRRVRQYRGVPPYPETRRHIKKVMRYYKRFKSIESKKGYTAQIAGS